MAPFRPATSIFALPNSKTLVVGVFSKVGNFTRNGLAVLNEVGLLDDDIDFGFEEGVTLNPNLVALDAQQRIVVAGENLRRSDGVGHRSIVGFLPSGVVDTTFLPPVLEAITILAAQSDGKLLVQRGGSKW